MCLRCAADLHPVGTRADRFGHAALEVELLAHLVEVGDLEVRAVAHGAGIRRELAEDELEQRGLAGAVRSDEADAVAAHQPQRQVGDDPALAEALRDVLELGDQLPGALARVERQPHAAHAFPPRGALVAQFLEPAHPARIARAAGLHALADPDLLLCPELVEAPALERLRGELLLLAPLVGGEVAGKGAQQAPVEFDDAGRDPVEERAVVSDDDGGRALEQQVLEQRDAVDVEVVGRLVEQQQLRLQRERERRVPHACALRPRRRRARHPPRARTDAGTRRAGSRHASAGARPRSARIDLAARGSRAAWPPPAGRAPARRAQCRARRGGGSRRRRGSVAPR